MQLVAVRQAGGKIDNARIQERRTRLKRVRHAHTIHFVENVIRQIDMLVKVQKALQAAPRLHFAQDGVQRSGIGKEEEAAFFCLGECSIPINVRQLRRKQGSFQKALKLVLKADLFIGYRKKSSATKCCPA